MSARMSTPHTDRLVRQGEIVKIIATAFPDVQVDVAFLPDDEASPTPQLHSLTVDFKPEKEDEDISMGPVWHRLNPALEAGQFRLDAATAANLSGGSGRFKLGITDLSSN